MLSLHPGIATCCLWYNSIFKILISVRYKKWLEVARGCKLLKFDWLVLIQLKIYLILSDLWTDTSHHCTDGLKCFNGSMLPKAFFNLYIVFGQDLRVMHIHEFCLQLDFLSQHTVWLLAQIFGNFFVFCPYIFSPEFNPSWILYVQQNDSWLVFHINEEMFHNFAKIIDYKKSCLEEMLWINEGQRNKKKRSRNLNVTETIWFPVLPLSRKKVFSVNSQSAPDSYVLLFTH